MSSRKVPKAVVPVVVVKGTLNGLGVVRSLGYGRMPIHLITSTRLCPGAWSRYCRVERYPSLNGCDLIDALRNLAVRIGQKPVLLLTGDAEVETVSNYREELEPLFRLSLPPKEMVHTLADKTLFQKFAEEEGFLVPRAAVLSEERDLALLDPLTPPCIVKPSSKLLVDRGLVKRAVRVETLEQARAVVRNMLLHGSPVVVQEWIDGEDTDIYFCLFVCDRNSKASRIFTGRKLVCSPPAVGSTAVCMAAPEAADELACVTRRFIARADYRGIGSLEFKRDPRDGKYYIVEPTVGRSDWQEEIATLCGVNIPLAAYWNEVMGQQEESAENARPIAWRSSMVHRVQRSALPPSTRIVDGHFRLSDPLPGLYYYAIEEFAWRVCGLAKRIFRFSAHTSGPAHP